MTDPARAQRTGRTAPGSPERVDPAGPQDAPGTAGPDEDGDRPAAAGLRVGRLLGRGATSAVWLVTDDGGRPFALKVARHPTPARRAASAQHAVPPQPAVAGGRRARRAADPQASTARPLEPGDPRGGLRGVPPAEDGPRQQAPGRGGGSVGLEQESRLLQRFAHEHLLRVHRVVDTDRGPGLLMDLAKGGSLLGLVTSRGPLPIPEVVTVLAPVAQVLDHLHGAGVLHGDVAPANILLTHEGKPLLGDLGTSMLLGSAPGVVEGTPGFLDPARQGSFDAGSDVFALAAVAWFALTGRVPGPTEQRPPLALIVPEVPPQLMRLIEDGLGADRGRRPTADEFARTLLASAVPAPVDLVSVVHASVLPELLTRRTDATAAPASRWERTTRRMRAPRSPSGHTPTRRPADPSRARRSRAAAGRPARAGGRTGPRPDGRPRGKLALMAGLTAAVLLVTGIALTFDGVGTTGAIPDGRTPAGQAERSEEAERRNARQGDGDLGGRRQEAGRTTSGAPADARDAEDPLTALGTLAARRAAAFATADPAVLVDVDVEGSPAMAADRDAVAALAGSGRALRDLSIEIGDPAEVTGAGLVALHAVAALPAVAAPPAATDVAVVRATAALSSYTEATLLPRPGDPPGPVMAAGRQELVFVLWRSEAGWRIHSVVSPPG
ncbi:protein kinase domain-containing protein [Arthrobacter agilis]|uniref:protein kinase domain-containing protein n=1 Tax=Arthrobacter agilis TaxID=37921 RepID=UPI0027811EA3|nr:serine/threonine-protein kinase [Arthrobacter agilis]MDQ0734382.1 serine/threonine protein kinase [Arthrobacter agilis]